MDDNIDLFEPELKWALSAFHQKTNDAYRKYTQYLIGDHRLAFATDKFREAFGELFREFSYNLCESVVAAHSDRLAIESFTGPSSDEASDTLGQRANDIWQLNNMDHHENQVESEMFGMGDAYVIVDTIDGRPVIWPQRATAVRVDYSTDVPGDIVRAARLWAINGAWRLNVYTKLHILKYTAPRNKDDFSVPRKSSVFLALETPGESWPLETLVPGEVPVFHFGNRAPVNEYGVSELRNVIPLQDALNKTVADMMVTMEFAAYPQRVAVGVDVEEATTQEAIKQFQLGVNRLLTLYGTDGGQTPSIAEFSAANITQYTAVIQAIEAMISKVSRVPQHYFAVRDFVSGASKRMSEAQFTAKMENCQMGTGAVWSRVAEYCLRLEGKPVTAGDIQVNWKPAAPISTDEEIEMMLARKSAGFPLATILREAGYDDKEIERIEIERNAERELQRSMFDMGFGLPSNAV